MLLLPCGAENHAAPEAPTVRLRRPVALALLDDGGKLFVANRASGSISIIDTRQSRVISETHIGRRLSDMAIAPAGNRVMLVDESAGQLILLARQANKLQVEQRIKVGSSPVSVQVSADGARATVADLWARRLGLIDWGQAAEKTARVAWLDLPFAPRRQIVVPGTSRLVVADAFGGKLAVVDLAGKKVLSVRDVSGHNIRGLGLGDGGTSLWLAHQRLNGFGHTTANEIQNSNVLSNNLRRFRLAAILDPLADPSGDDRIYQVGDIEKGGGDPVDVIEIAPGEVVTALAGTNEIAIGRPDKVIWTRLAVGRRPTALALDRQRRRLYVANTFADSISVVDLDGPRVIAEISLGTARTELRAEERGEMLFYDARLSHLAWFSCHSCHPDGHTNGRLNDNLSDGSFGTPKRVLSLLGVKNTGPWAWNGKMPDLESQVRTSLKTTMRGPTPSIEQVRDLAAFLRTLSPPPSLREARGSGNPEAVQRGRKIFAREKCATCHTPPTYTSAKTYDVGLKDEDGGTHFNPPSLRGVSQGGPYFHDNRAHTLAEVFTRFRHQLPGELKKQELDDLLDFLASL